MALPLYLAQANGVASLALAVTMANHLSSEVDPDLLRESVIILRERRPLSLPLLLKTTPKI